MEDGYIEKQKDLYSNINYILLLILTFILVYKEQKIAILGYHSFVESKYKSNYNDPMIMNIDKFEQ